MSPFDVNDPTTWPDDEAELLKLATAGDDTPEEPKSEEPKSEEPKSEEPKSEEPKSEEPEGDILAADGKNLIPHAVLRETRTRLHGMEAALAQAQAELEELRAQTAASPSEKAVTVALNTLPDDVKAQVEKIRENWGDEFATQAEKTYWLERRAAEQQAAIESLNQYIENQRQASQRTEQDLISDAIAASPKLYAWATAEDQSWFDRAVELSNTLVKIDPVYAAASWEKRMKVLPTRVEALFSNVSVASTETKKVDTAAARAVVEKTLETPPTSLSEIPGGTSPEQGELQKLENLSGNQLSAFMNKLAEDPKKFEAYLRAIG